MVQILAKKYLLWLQFTQLSVQLHSTNPEYNEENNLNCCVRNLQYTPTSPVVFGFYFWIFTTQQFEIKSMLNVFLTEELWIIDMVKHPSASDYDSEVMNINCLSFYHLSFWTILRTQVIRNLSGWSSNFWRCIIFANELCQCFFYLFIEERNMAPRNIVFNKWLKYRDLTKLDNSAAVLLFLDDTIVVANRYRYCWWC